MLSALRSFVGSWAAKILLILLVGSFALWGVSGSILGGADNSTVAQVGETKIGVRDYSSSYNRNMNDIQRRLGRRLTREEGRVFGVENRTLGEVISLGTLDEYAREKNVSLSEKTLAEMIASNPQFQDSTGKFNRDRFRRAVYEAQMREGDFVVLQNKSAVRSQVTQAFARGKIVPDVFTNAMGRFAQEQRKFNFIAITPDMAGDIPTPTEEQLKEYFEANKAKYRAPEYRKLTLLAVEPKDIAEEASITEAAIKADYEERKATYEKPEQRRVEQIVFKSRDAADKAAKDLADGELFETVLTDNDLKQSDVDLGLIAKDKLPAAFQDAAFSLPLNEPSAILDGPFGPTMLRIAEVVPATTTPIEEVESDIRKDLALRQAADAITNMQTQIEDLRAGGGSLEDAAKRFNLDIRVIDAVSQTAQAPDDTVINDIPESRKLLEEAFKTPVGVQTNPLDYGQAGYVWFNVDAIEAARDRTFEESKEKVTQDWIAEETLKSVNKKAEEIKERLAKGETLATISLELDAPLKNTRFLKRNEQDTDFPVGATQAGFSGDTKQIAIVDSSKAGEKLLLEVAEQKLPEAQLAAVPEAEVDLANEGGSNDLLSQLIANLQTKYEITDNPTLINQILTQNR